MLRSCRRLSFIETILRSLQTEIPFQNHLSFPELAELIYLNLIDSEDIISSVQNISFSDKTQPYQPHILKDRAFFLIQHPSLLDSGLNFSQLFLAAFVNQDLNLIKSILFSAQKSHPSYSEDQLWHLILPKDYPLHIDCQTDIDNLLWLDAHYPQYAPLLDINFHLFSLRLKKYITPQILQNQLYLLIKNHHHFDEILFYKNHFDIPDSQWELILQTVIALEPLSPGTLCILRHHPPSFPHKCLNIQFTSISFFKASVTHFSQLKPYLTPEDKIYVDMVIAVKLGDILSVKNILKTHLFPHKFIYKCLSHALICRHRKLHIFLKQYIQTIPQPELYPYLYNETILLGKNSLQISLFKDLPQIIAFFSQRREIDLLLIHLLESGYFSPDSPLNTLFFLQKNFFLTRLIFTDFYPLSSYLLYNDIGDFLEDKISKQPRPYPPLPPYFFRPVSTQLPLFLYNDAQSNLAKRFLHSRQPHFHTPNRLHIYA